MQVLKEDIRSRVLAAARRQFGRKGYSGTSMREIAASAGVGVGNIYNYFTSKDDLFREVVRPVLCALEAMLQEHHGIRGEDIMAMRSEKYLESCIDEYVSLIDRHRGLMEILLLRAQGSSLEHFRLETMNPSRFRLSPPGTVVIGAVYFLYIRICSPSSPCTMQRYSQP